MSDTQVKPASKTAEAAAAAGGVVCVIDLGEHSRKRVRKLRRGEGRLMEKVENAVAALVAEGALDSKAQTVVVVVRQEPSVGGLFGSDDDDDDD